MIKRLLASLQPVWRLCCLYYYQAALRQIDPLHEDVPHIVRRLNEIEHSRSAA